jgi:hypothetical protein
LANVKKQQYPTPLMYSPAFRGEQTRKRSVKGREGVVVAAKLWHRKEVNLNTYKKFRTFALTLKTKEINPRARSYK